MLEVCTVRSLYTGTQNRNVFLNAEFIDEQDIKAVPLENFCFRLLGKTKVKNVGRELASGWEITWSDGEAFNQTR